MAGVALAGFYTQNPKDSESLLNNIMQVVDKEGIPHNWAGDPPVTPDNIGPDNELILHVEDKQIRIAFETRELPDRRLQNFLSVSTPACNLTIANDPTDQYKGFTAAFVNLLRRLSVVLEPDYGFVGYPDPDVGPSPFEVMPTEGEFEIERLPWLSIYSPSLIDQFGWTGRISDAPAWKTEQLDTGAFLLIKTKDPWEDVSRDHPLDRYLLDGEGQ